MSNRSMNINPFGEMCLYLQKANRHIRLNINLSLFFMLIFVQFFTFIGFSSLTAKLKIQSTCREQKKEKVVRNIVQQATYYRCQMHTFFLYILNIYKVERHFVIIHFIQSIIKIIGNWIATKNALLQYKSLFECWKKSKYFIRLITKSNFKCYITTRVNMKKKTQTYISN